VADNENELIPITWCGLGGCRFGKPGAKYALRNLVIVQEVSEIGGPASRFGMASWSISYRINVYWLTLRPELLEGR
jgi:hypothetical protein